MHLLASGSNGSGQLAISHLSDVHSFTPTQFHPSVQHLLPGATILDLVSVSTHALLLLRTAESPGAASRNILLGAGTNTLGQLGPKCALWETSRAETRWKPVDLLSGAGVGGHDEWEAVKIAATWTTSFVVYRRMGPSAAHGTAREDSENGFGPSEILLSCGSNDFGELGRSESASTSDNAVSPSDFPTIINLGLQAGETVELIRGGQRHVLAVIADGTAQRVIGWGANRKGELDSSTADGMTQAQQPRASSSRKGKGKAVSRAPILPPTELRLDIPTGTRITDIRLGASHSLALLSDGRILAWGSDAKGQINGLSSIRQAIAIGATWGGSYVLRQADEGLQMLSQGANTYSQLLRPSSGGQPGSGPVVLPRQGKVVRFAAGSEHLLVHLCPGDGDGRQMEGDTDELWVGGWNEHGNLGLGDTEDRGELASVDLLRALNGTAGLKGEANGGSPSYRIRGISGGCAASWVWLDTAGAFDVPRRRHETDCRRSLNQDFRVSLTIDPPRLRNP